MCFLFMCICLEDYMYTVCTGALRGQEVIGFPGTGVKGDCKLPKMDGENRTIHWSSARAASLLNS